MENRDTQLCQRLKDASYLSASVGLESKFRHMLLGLGGLEGLEGLGGGKG